MADGHHELAGAGALIAGGASGLGAATARRLAAYGARVVIADVNEAAGNDLAAELGAEFVRVDVTDEAQVSAAVRTAAEAPRGLRVAVACAGITAAAKTVGKGGPHTLETFQRVIGVNLVGTFNLLRLAAAEMAGNQPEADGARGVVVATASVAAFDGQIGQVAYAASKGGIAAMTLPPARDLARSGIRVCTIAPGTFDTPLMDVLSEEARASLAAAIPYPSRLGKPEEFAALVEQIVRNPMLNGETIRLDGALRLTPR